jgi:hypothetical protein
MKKSTILVLGTIVLGIGFVRADNTTAPAAPTPAAPAALPAGQAGAPAATAAAPANVTVEKIAVGTAIDNKEISGEAAQFGSSSERIYCWTKVSTDQAPVTIKHMWSADGKKEAEVALEIKYPSARTWSSKNVWPGSWKVEVIDDQGKVLSSKEFTVTKEAAATPAAGTPAPATAPPPQVGQ